MVKYLANIGFCQQGPYSITEVEVERGTDSSVWINGQRRAIVTVSERYYDSWDTAHAFILERAESDYKYKLREYQQAHDRLGNVKGMKKPKGAR